MGQHKHRRMVGRLGSPPACPFLIPVPADRAEHVPTHHIRRAHEPLFRDLVGMVGAWVADVPAVQLKPPLTSGSSRLWSGPATKPSRETDMWQVVSGT